MKLVADVGLFGLGNAVLVKGLAEQSGNLRGLSSFDLMPLEQEQGLSVPKQAD